MKRYKSEQEIVELTYAEVKEEFKNIIETDEVIFRKVKPYIGTFSYEE